MITRLLLYKTDTSSSNAMDIPSYGYNNYTQQITDTISPAQMNKDDDVRSKAPRRGKLQRGFSLKRSTEWNNSTDEELFFGPYAHIRKTIDYNYHSNYVKTRQWLQDSIIDKLIAELVRTSACDEYDSKSSTPHNILNNGSGIDIWAKPKGECFLIPRRDETNQKGHHSGPCI